MHVRNVVLVLAAGLAMALAVSGQASAAERQCFFYDGPDGDAMHVPYRDVKVTVISFVRPGGTMKCASAQFVINRLASQWRRQGFFTRTWSDGYVTWHGRVIGRRPWGAQIIRYSERRSGTWLTFDSQVTYF
jgi:hypothetical protein